MKKNQKSILISIGLMISSVAQIVSHFMTMPDFVRGSFIGIGIGVMILAFIKPRRRMMC